MNVFPGITAGYLKHFLHDCIFFQASQISESEVLRYFYKLNDPTSLSLC